MKTKLLPPANVVCEGYVFTGVCLSTGGACVAAPPPPGHYEIRSVNARAVRILLECILINAEICFFLFDAVTSIVVIFVKFQNWSEQDWRSRILMKCSLRSIKMEMTRFNSMVNKRYKKGQLFINSAYFWCLPPNDFPLNLTTCEIYTHKFYFIWFQSFCSLLRLACNSSEKFWEQRPHQDQCFSTPSKLPRRLKRTELSPKLMLNIWYRSFIINKSECYTATIYP